MAISLRKLAKAHRLRQRELAEVLKTDQSVVSLIINGHRRLNEEHISLLKERFGDEELIKYQVDEEDVRRENVEMTYYPAELVEEVREEVRKELADEGELKETVILTPEIINQEDIDIRKELNEGTLDAPVKPTQDVLPPHHAKVYTENDEMAPEIEANDPVFVRFLASKRDYISGRMYFVDLDNGSVVRWVVREDEEHIRLYSMKDEEIVPISRVRSISEVVAITKRPKTLPKHRITMEDVIAHKDAQIDMVNSQIDTVLEQQGRLIGIIEKHNGINNNN
ncbi:MAG: hypothetical protein J6U49_07010 [Alistipes sp.]|nr:hypothetical protein [Alistipes sp.]